MRKCYILLTAFLCSYSIKAQVGINTDNPQATLDVQKSTSATPRAMGIIPPRVTGDELRLNAGLYGAAQNGALVYVTTPVTATNEPKTSGVTTRGLFIYDALEPNGSGNGSWQILPDGPAAPATGGTGDGAYAARFTGSSSLLSLNVGLGTTFYAIPLSNVAVNNNIPSTQVANNQ